MSNAKPRKSSSNMVKRQQMPSTYQIGETNSASGSRSVRESGSVIDNNSTDHNSLRSNRSRPLARLDRLLRRWLPGYNLIRCAFANSNNSGNASDNASNRPETDTTIRPSLEEQRQVSISVEPTLPVIKRKDGEVVLDTGIAKSEFCMKLEKLLRAKLIVKE